MNRPAKAAAAGTFFGIGVGPGDPELITLKAQRLIQSCDLLTYLQSESGNAMARQIVEQCIAGGSKSGQIEHGIIMPMSDSRDVANQVYDEGAKIITETLDQGKNVAFLCLGDPLFFGSFSYLYHRLGDHYHTEIVPGISSINASAALVGRSIGLLSENIAIISGRRSVADILKTLVEFDNVVIMKPGRKREQLLALIAQADRSADTCYIEYAGQPQQRIVQDISTLEPGNGPYFSLFLISRTRQYSGDSDA